LRRYTTAGVDVAVWDPDACARLQTLAPPNWKAARAPPTMTGVAFVAGQPLLAAGPDRICRNFLSRHFREFQISRIFREFWHFIRNLGTLRNISGQY